MELTYNVNTGVMYYTHAGVRTAFIDSQSLLDTVRGFDIDVSDLVEEPQVITLGDWTA